MSDKIMSLTKTPNNPFAPCFYCGESSEAIARYKTFSEARVCLNCAKLIGKWTRNRKGWGNIPTEQKETISERNLQENHSRMAQKKEGVTV